MIYGRPILSPYYNEKRRLKEDENWEEMSQMFSGRVGILTQGKLAQGAWTTDQGVGDRVGREVGWGSHRAEGQVDGASAQEGGLPWNYPASR